MRFFFKLFRRRNADLSLLEPHLRRDIGLPEFDRSDWLIGRQIASTRRWM